MAFRLANYLPGARNRQRAKLLAELSSTWKWRTIGALAASIACSQSHTRRVLATMARPSRSNPDLYTLLPWTASVPATHIETDPRDKLQQALSDPRYSSRKLTTLAGLINRSTDDTRVLLVGMGATIRGNFASL